MWTLKHSRPDGTFVIDMNGYPYHVTKDDPLYEKAFADASDVELESEPAPQNEPISTWDQVRQRRNALLSDSDWTQLADVVLSDELKQAWRAYRQQLRDLPNNGESPESVSWPVEPGA
jgi:hypothetical protein